MMNVRNVVCGAVVVLALGTASSVQAQTMTEALTRIDAIISEMQKLRAEFARLVGAAPAQTAPVTPTVPAGAVLGAGTTQVLTGDLSYGATSESITRVQKLLATDAEIYADGTVSGFYGPKTQEAIRRFQARFGLDTVGVIGPSTKAVLEAFMQAYPTENYPAGVLKGAAPKPTTSVITPLPTSPAPVVSAPGTTGVYSSIAATGDGEDYDIVVKYTDGRRDLVQTVATRSEKDVAAAVARRLGVSESVVKAVLTVNTRAGSRSSDDEAEAEELLAEAEADLRAARSEIRNAKDDGDDVEEAEEIYDEARDLFKEAEEAFENADYDDVVEFAEEVIDLARKTERAID